MAVTQIDTYVVMYSANRFVPRIWMKHGSQYIGQLISRPNGTTLPVDSMSGGLANLYYHLDDFQNAIDVLRNESPVYLLYTGSGPGFENGVLTSTEPVGEGEEI